MQKIQDQIIAPSQTIYVAPYGNDDNDGTVPEKAVKTLDRAIELARDNIPELNIIIFPNPTDEGNIIQLSQPIYCEKDLYRYPTSKKLKNISITTDYNALLANNFKMPKIKIPFGYKWFGQYLNKEGKPNVYAFGNFFILNCDKVTLNYLELDASAPYNANSDYFLNALFINTHNISINSTKITLGKDTALVNMFDEILSTLVISGSTNIQGDGWLVRCKRPKLFKKDWDKQDFNAEGMAYATASGINSIINIYLKTKSAVIDTTITNKQNGGFTDNVKIGLKNF